MKTLSNNLEFYKGFHEKAQKQGCAWDILPKNNDEIEISRSYINLVSVLTLDRAYSLRLFPSVLWQCFKNCFGTSEMQVLYLILACWLSLSVHDSNSITINPTGSRHLL